MVNCEIATPFLPTIGRRARNDYASGHCEELGDEAILFFEAL